MKNDTFEVLLYYKYVHIENPEELRNEQRKFCEEHNLKGRIIVANEGINGTLEGNIQDTQKYIEWMENQKEFQKINYKKSAGTGNAFPKLKVRVRPEIVTARLPELNPNKTTGKYLSEDELFQWFQDKKEFYVVDMRNDYEYASGYFEGFIPSGLKNFFDLKNVLPKLAHLKNKTVLTVCTGGVRCEKASGFLVENGFKDVYQLKNGIQTFMEKYPNTYFKGKLYVFDNRLTLAFNSSETETVGRCMHCNTPCDEYTNCEYDACHMHYICCKNCKDKETGFAFSSASCKKNYLELQLKNNPSRFTAAA